MRRLLLLGAALGVVGLGWSAFREWRAADGEFHPARGPVPFPAAVPEWPGRRDARFASAAGDALRGWWAPPRGTAAAVVLVHGTQADRRQLADLGAALAAAGVGVLAYDQPGCGESGGRVTWGHSERAALTAAVEWAGRQPGVRAVGVFGFSQGAYIAAEVAPGDAAVRALAVAGTPARLLEETRYEYRRPMWLLGIPALIARFTGGWRPDVPEPEAAIARFAPRPLLVIGGSADPVVPPEDAGRVFRAAGEPRTLWMVPGAGHGDYARAAPGEYPRRVVEFFVRAVGEAALAR